MTSGWFREVGEADGDLGDNPLSSKKKIPQITFFALIGSFFPSLY